MEGRKFAWWPFWAGLVSLLGLALLAQGCAGAQHRSIPAGSAGKMQRLDVGTVVAVERVTIDGEKTFIGPSAGGVIGSAVGQTVGSGDGRVLAAAVGAAGGAVLGGMVEKELSEKHAQELTVALDDGGTTVIVQEIEDPPFIEGDRVRITSTPTGEARVSHAGFETDGLY